MQSIPKINRRKTEERSVINLFLETNLQCTFQKVCDVIKDQVHNPMDYLDGIDEVLFYTGDFLKRTTVINNKEFIEKIVWDIGIDNAVFTYLLIDNKDYEGEMRFVIKKVNDNGIKLQFYMVWNYKDIDNKVSLMGGNIEKYMRILFFKVKERCEN